MYELTVSDCEYVAGGSGQVCGPIANGGTQCTSISRNAMVINTYDSKGNLRSTTVCGDNRTVSGGLKAGPKAGITGSVGGGSGCTTQNFAQDGPAGGSVDLKQLVIYGPFSYGAP